MKQTIIWTLAIVAVIGAIIIVGSRGGETKVVNHTTVEEKKVEVEVDTLQKQVADAIAASSTDIEARAQKAYDDAKKQAEVEIELAVTEKYGQMIEAKKKELEAQSIAYWREIDHVKQLIRETFPDDPRMVEVARLESGFVHYKENGQVLKGQKTPADTGLMQVNCDHWCDDAQRLGLNIWNIVDNVKMARYIYDTQGITAWVAWNKVQAAE